MGDTKNQESMLADQARELYRLNNVLTEKDREIERLNGIVQSQAFLKECAETPLMRDVLAQLSASQASEREAVERAEKAEAEILEAAIDRICADDSWHTNDVAWHACFPALFDIIRGHK